MRCKVCQYRLWNLPARQCPECGTPFRPSEFEFVAGSVQFCCPHCDLPYYGLAPNGHLDPTYFNCANCGQPVHMDHMVLRPAEHLSEEQTEVDHNPWLQRQRRGRVKAWFAMIGRSMVAPSKLMRATPVQSSTNQAFFYATITNVIIYLFSTTVGMLFFAIIPLITMVGMRGAGGPFAGGGFFFCCGGGAVLLVLGAVLMMLLYIAIWGAVAHGLLMWGGKPVAGIGRTYQALCYSCGPNALMAVPCIGGYLSPVSTIWWLVSAILMLRQGQQVHGGRATLAVLALPVVSTLAVAGVIIVLFSLAVIQGSATMTTVLAVPGGVAPAVNDYARANNGTGPAHAVELIADGSLTASDFIDDTSATAEADVPVGGMTLDQFEAAGTALQTATEQRAIATLPPNTIAHRLGDFVFVYHGINFTQADPRLWTVIQWPDPDADGSTPGTVQVGQVGGSAQAFPVSSLTTELSTQNALRQTANLPPIPHPSTVTHSRPATGAAPGSQ